MKFFYYFSGSKIFVFLEEHRARVYAVAYLVILALLLTLYVSDKRLLQDGYVVGIFLLTSLLLLYLNIVFQRAQNWLSAKTRMAMDVVRLPSIISSVRNKLSNVGGLAFSILVIALLLLPIIWLLFPRFIPGPTIAEFVQVYGRGAFLKTLWQVDATIVSITFVIISLIWELSKSNNPLVTKASDYVMNRSFYKQITVINFTALIFIGYLTYVDVGVTRNVELFSALSMFLFNFAILSTIYLFLQVISLTDPTNLLMAIKNAIGDKIRSSMWDEFFSRVSMNLLIEDGKSSGYEGFGMDLRDELRGISIIADNPKIVRDIDLGRIHSISKSLKKIINSRSGAKLTITKTIGSFLDKDSPVVARVHPDDFSESIAKRIISCFEVENIDENDEVRDLSESLRDYVIQAIDVESKSKLTLALNVYEKTYQEALNLFSELGARFDFETSHSAFVETRSLMLIASNFREIINASFRKGDIDLITDILYFPFKIMRLAVVHRDHLIYKQAIQFYTYSYGAFKKFYGGTEKSIVVDRLWRHIDEFADFILKPAASTLVKSSKGNKLLVGYIKEIFLVLNSLAKLSIDYQEEAAFNDFTKAIDKIFNYLLSDRRTLDRFEISRLNIEINKAATDEERRNLRKKIAVSKRWARIKRDITTHRQVIMFGLGAWLFKCLKDGSVTKEFSTSLINKIIDKFTNLKELSELYFEVDRREIGDLYSWGWWVTQGLEEGVAHSVDKSWLTEFYCLAAIRKINIDGDSHLAALPSPNTGQYFSAAGLGYLFEQVAQILNRIKDDRYLNNLDLLPTENLSEKIEALGAYHKRGVTVKKEEEEIKLRDAPLNADTIKEFSSSLVHYWKENSILRKLFTKNGSYIDRSNEPTGGPREILHLNKLESKELFIAAPSDSDEKISKHFASAVVRGEDEKIAKYIFENISLKKRTASTDFLINLENSLRAFQESGYTATVILLSGWKTADLIRESTKFVPSWQISKDKKEPGLYGYFEKIPIFNVMLSDVEGGLTIVDISKFGVLEQFGLGGDKILADGIWVSIDLIDRAKFEELVKGNDRLLIDNKTGARKDKEEAFKEFQKYVHLRIQEKFTVTVKDANAGVILTIVE